jgi:pimeloyl-ACP methyl ester carboxylesterase
MARSSRLAAIAALIVLAASACSVKPVGGHTEWLTTPSGRLKAQTFISPKAGDHPVLVVVLHGDAPFNRPGYQYDFAREAAGTGDVAVAAILRPGYTDPSGDRSSGERGLTTGDNYTRDRIDMIAAAIGELRQRHNARAVILVGHSGGAAISADLLALHPHLAQAALLVSCPCDLPAWRAHMKATQRAAIWDRPVSSLSPIALAAQVPRGDRVRMIVGSIDNVAPPGLTEAYAAALRSVDVEVTELPGKGHEIFLEPAVQDQLAELVKMTAR